MLSDFLAHLALDDPPRASRRRHRGRHRHGPRRRRHPGCARQRRHLRRDGTGRAVAGASSRCAPRAGQGAAATTKDGSTRPCTPARWTPRSPWPRSGRATMATDDNFFHTFERTALAAPDAACLDLPGGVVLSRAWLSHQSARYAGALGAAGCRPGDRVAVQVDKSPHALALYLACIRAGLVYLPANTAYRPAELAYLIADGRPRIFVGRAEPARRSTCSTDPSRRRPFSSSTRTEQARSKTSRRRRGRPRTSWHGAPTMSRHCSTPPAPPAGRRVRC